VRNFLKSKLSCKKIQKQTQAVAFSRVCISPSSTQAEKFVPDIPLMSMIVTGSHFLQYTETKAGAGLVV
jgi:hypothetical protein